MVQVSGIGKSTWASLLEGLREGGQGEFLDGDYFRVPVLVEGQDVFRFNEGFIARLKQCRYLEGMEA